MDKHATCAQFFFNNLNKATHMNMLVYSLEHEYRVQVCSFQSYQTTTAAMMRIMIPVTSPPRYAPTSAAVFDVSGSLPSGGSGVGVGLGSGGLGSRSGVQEGYMQ